jgi:hypothetical protein
LGIKISFEDFLSYFRKHPGLNNKHYYKEFPDTPKGTIRYWKMKALEMINKSPTNVDHTTNHGKNGTPSHNISPPQQNKVSAPSSLPNYKNFNIKSLLKNWGIHQLVNSTKNAAKGVDILMKEEFLNQAEVQDQIYWNADTPPYQRPSWLYSWQHLGIELMKAGHCMWQASRQKPGKTTAAGIADFEDALESPGSIVSIFAPTVPVGKTLMRQMFKEVITLEDGSKFDLWNQLFKPYVLIDNVLDKVLKNGSRIQVITLDYKAVQGLASDVIHIEELDKAVREPQKLEAIAALFPQIRARRGRAKIRITCNNASGIYRIFRDELKQFGQYFQIFMEKPNLEAKFTGEHFIYNEHIRIEREPDVDEILKVIMDTVMGEGYTKMQLYNVDDYTGDLWNPDKLEKAYKKSIPNTTRYDHAWMGVDPGAIHAFAITVFGRNGDQIFHLATKRFSLSDTPAKDHDKMIDMIANECAYLYCKYHCEGIASESNSGARLIIPAIGRRVEQYIEELHGKSHAVWRVIWSNFAADSENLPNVKRVPKSDYITLMSYLIDYEMITFQDSDNDSHIMRIEFARYDPSETKERYKGDCVDSAMHACWWLCGGMDYVKKLIGKKRKLRMETW